MDIENLITTYPKLQQYLSDNHYSEGYIKQINQTFNFILRHNSNHWNNYFDVDRDYCNTKSVTANNRHHVSLNVIANFDCYGNYPTGSRKDNYFKINLLLSQPFQEFLEYVEVMANFNGLADSYNLRCITTLKCFMSHLQDRGFKSFKKVRAKDVISFFSNGTEPIKSHASALCLRHALETGMNWSEDIRNIYIEIPIIRGRRKNIQYLTEEEIAALLKALEDETTGLSLCARAIGYLLYYTGLRACDIAGMKLSDIDWDKELIILVQHKTGKPLTLPLPIKAGNMIYRYLTEERSECDSEFLFIRSNAPIKPYSHGSIGATICKQLFKAAKIRQNPGDRQGSHIFRHNIVKEMIEKGVSKPIISSIAGHSDPTTLNSYLTTDFCHLKECALSVERFPINPEVFNNE